jgi:glutathione peroxidase
LTKAHYEQFVALYEKYHDQGFEILAFPSNEFGKQEPKSNEEIQKFVADFGVKFPVFTKTTVNGKHAHPVFNFLRAKLTGLLGAYIKWNFTKFLCDRDGIPVKRYAPPTKPNDLEEDLIALLAKPATAAPDAANQQTEAAPSNAHSSSAPSEAKPSEEGDDGDDDVIVVQEHPKSSGKKKKKKKTKTPRSETSPRLTAEETAESSSAPVSAETEQPTTTAAAAITTTTTTAAAATTKDEHPIEEKPTEEKVIEVDKPAAEETVAIEAEKSAEMEKPVEEEEEKKPANEEKIGEEKPAEVEKPAAVAVEDDHEESSAVVPTNEHVEVE